MKSQISFQAMNKALIASLLFVLCACGGGRTFVKSPVDELIRDLSPKKTFSIILHDMDVIEHTFSSEYKHKYRIISAVDSIPEEYTTDWMTVNESYFWKNEDNMGMELASKDESGKLSKVPSPPGYNNYVGNQHYGYWGSGGFWQFYGQYAFMSSMFGMMNRPVYQYDYNTYRRDYYGRKPYYGSNSSNPTYGTRSAHSRKTNPNFYQRRQQKSGWSRSRSGVYGGSKNTVKGTSRYNSSGGFRSSGGGFGK